MIILVVRARAGSAFPDASAGGPVEDAPEGLPCKLADDID